MSATNDTAPGPEWNGLNLNVVLSPFYWGSVVSLVLYGITLLQAYMYFPSKDKLFIQVFAAVLFMFDTVSVALVSQGFAYYIIPHFGSLLPFAHLTPILAVECTIGMTVIFLSQCYFAWQVYTVWPRGKAGRYLVPGTIWGLAIITAAAGIACSVVMLTDSQNILSDRSLSFSLAAGLSKGLAAVVDVLATAALCYCLASAKTGFKQTDHLVKSVITWVIQRGFLVSILQSLVLLVFFAKQANLYWLPVHVNVTRLYVNTFFVMLNARQDLKKNYEVTSGATTWGVRVDTVKSSDFGLHALKSHGVTSQVQAEGKDDLEGQSYLRLSKPNKSDF